MTLATTLTAAPVSNLAERFAPVAGRAALSSIFLWSGVAKIQNYAATQGYMEALGVPGALLPVAIAFEIAAPLAVVLGWHARIAAFLLAGFSVLTALIFHFDFADQIQSIMFMKNIAIAGGFLLLTASGPGPFSLSNREAR